MRARSLAPVLLLALVPAARGQAPPPDAEAELRQQKQTAITKGVRWLCEQQQADGSWTYDNKPLILGPDYYPMSQGVTALCAFTLLKCGVEPQDPHIEKAFAYIRGQDLKYTYAVSCVLLALEAKSNPEARADEEETRERKPARKAPPPAGDMELARRCVDFLAQHQQVGLWRYPSGTQEDVSNAQYALLALDAAERMGVSVPKAIFEKVAVRLIDAQQQDGEVVPTFPVPGADRTFRELKKIQDELEREIKALEKRYKDPAKPDKEGQTLADRTTTAERGAARKLLETTTQRGSEMRARGWAYYVPGTRGSAWQTTVNGSMTASGLAALFICKSHLEGTPKWDRELRERGDKALRDGAAWLARNYTVTENPGVPNHAFYYLYGFERASILGLIGRYGEHDWYLDGCRHVLRVQQATGEWNAGLRGTAGAVPDTCFALLFLSRGTTPVIKVPRRVMTGGNAYGPAAGQGAGSSTPPR